MDHAFGVISKKHLYNPRSQRFSSVLPSKSLSILSFTFRCMIHVEFIFVHGIKYPIATPLARKDYSVTTELFLQLCQKAVIQVPVNIFLDSLCCPFDLLLVYLWQCPTFLIIVAT